MNFILKFNFIEIFHYNIFRFKICTVNFHQGKAVHILNTFLKN